MPHWYLMKLAQGTATFLPSSHRLRRLLPDTQTLLQGRAPYPSGCCKWDAQRTKDFYSHKAGPEDGFLHSVT